MGEGWVYVLELQHRRWYVGHTPREEHLPVLADELAGYGSPYLVLHPAVRVESMYRGDCWMAEEIGNLHIRFLGPMYVRRVNHDRLFQDRKPRGMWGKRLFGSAFGEEMRAYAEVQMPEEQLPSAEIIRASPLSLEADLAAKRLKPEEFNRRRDRRAADRTLVERAIARRLELHQLRKLEEKRKS